MTPLLVLGDSHGEVFRQPLFAARFPDHTWDCVIVPGATASGLENPNNSKTQAYPAFKQALSGSNARRVIVSLGEVDTGFVIWYRARKYKESVFAMLDRAVDAYARFLGEFAADHELLCVSTPLPTIRDGAPWGEVANLRKEVDASQRARTALTLEFNRRMCQRALGLGVSYLSLDGRSLGADGLVRPELMHANPSDHHYAPDRYAELIAAELPPFLMRPLRS